MKQRYKIRGCRDEKRPQHEIADLEETKRSDFYCRSRSDVQFEFRIETWIVKRSHDMAEQRDELGRMSFDGRHNVSDSPNMAALSHQKYG